MPATRAVAELTDDVIRQVPYLRRYARAILGDRDRSDEAVGATLKRFAGRESRLVRGPAGEREIRILLYRALHAVWGGGCHIVPEQEPTARHLENDAIVGARVGQLGPRKRQMLVLTALEGFSIAEAAAVMGVQIDAAKALLGQARDELRWQKASRILIIEDEPIIALDIASTIRQSGHTVVGIASTHKEAVAVAERETPELILADIQLADDSSGVAAVQQILCGRYLPVVFITAFPERLVGDMRPEPIFLITKPFDAETLRISISQALAGGTMRGQAYLQ